METMTVDWESLASELGVGNTHEDIVEYTVEKKVLQLERLSLQSKNTPAISM